MGQKLFGSRTDRALKRERGRGRSGPPTREVNTGRHRELRCEKMPTSLQDRGVTTRSQSGTMVARERVERGQEPDVPKRGALLGQT